MATVTISVEEYDELRSYKQMVETSGKFTTIIDYEHNDPINRKFITNDDLAQELILEIQRNRDSSNRYRTDRSPKLSNSDLYEKLSDIESKIKRIKKAKIVI